MTLAAPASYCEPGLTNNNYLIEVHFIPIHTLSLQFAPFHTLLLNFWFACSIGHVVEEERDASKGVEFLTSSRQQWATSNLGNHISWHLCLHYLGEKRKEMGRKGAERGGESGRVVRVRKNGREKRFYLCELHFSNQISMRLIRYLRNMTQRWQRMYAQETSFLFLMLQLFSGVFRSVGKREDY